MPGANSQQTLTLTATSVAALADNVAVQLVATRASDGATASSTFTLTSGPQLGGLPANRTVFVRTGDIPSSAVYDSVHQLVFASEPDLGLVDAISIPGAQIVARIAVPGVEAVGISADDSKILASTNTQQVAWIDTVQRRVIQWQLLPLVNDPVAGLRFWTPYNPESVLSNFGDPSSLPVYGQNPYLMVNGKVLFEALEAGFTPAVVEWDPVANAAILRKDLPAGGFVKANTAGTKILFVAQPGVYDPTTDTFTTSSSLGYAGIAASNPEGTQFAFFKGSSIVFTDNQMNIVGQAQLSEFTGATGLVYSADGARLYMLSTGIPAVITTFDATNFSIIGTANAYSNGDPRVAFDIDTPLAADDTGLVIGSVVGGLVFDDSADFFTIPQNPQISSARISPSEGPVAGGTVTTIKGALLGEVPDVRFGSQEAATVDASALPQISATTPPASAEGVVDVKIIEPTGVMQIIPQAFTYGSVPLLTAPLATTPTGDVGVPIYGFGLSAELGPTAQHVTIGTKPAAVFETALDQGFPYQALFLDVPAGSPGSADIVVNSPTGTATYPKGFRYLSGVTDYASSDHFSAVLYDSTRNQLYLNAGDHIDVFSLVTNTFGSSITPPSIGGTRQLQGMALTPDGSKLIVGNFADDSVCVISPDNPATAKAVQIAPPVGPDSLPEGPHGVATTSLGTVLVDIGTTNQLSGGGGVIYELNLATLKSTLRDDVATNIQVFGELMGQSGDGSEVFFATPDDSGGEIMTWYAATNSWKAHNVGGLFFLFYDDVAVARDGNVFSVNNALNSDFSFPMFFDSQLNQTSQFGIEAIFAAVNQRGMALHDSGALLYSSTDLGVDIIDVHHGALAERIVLDENDAFQTGSLAVDETGAKLFVITDAGLTVIQLDAVPLSIGSVTPNSGIAGTTVTVRGSGFTAGSTVSLNGMAAIVTFKDSDTLQLVVPASLLGGPVSATITNVDGSTYTLDSAFTIN